MKFSFGPRRAREEPAPVTLQVAETDAARVEYPSYFEEVAFEGADLALRLREDRPDFRPNLVLTSVTSTAPLVDASVTALLAAGIQHPGSQVLSCDLWHLDESDELARARRIRFVYPGDDTRDVIVTKWVWATGHQHVHLAASCLPSQLSEMDTAFEWVAQRLRPRGSDEDVARAARTPGAAVQDLCASERVAAPLEDLSVIAPPPPAGHGALIEADDLQLLATVARDGGMGRDERDTQSALRLAAAGWIDERGRVSGPGADIAQALAADRPILTVKARRGDHAALLSAVAGTSGALVLCDAPPVGGEPRADRLKEASWVPAEKLPALLARWIGLHPTWAFDDAAMVSESDLERRITADESGFEPWTELLIRDGRGDRYGVHSPSDGYFRVGAPGLEGHGLHADPAAAIFDHIVTACDRAFRPGA